MWLKRLEVKNFRSLENVKLDFTPGVNVLIGENGTGKTNLMKAVLKILGPSYPGAGSFSYLDHYLCDESRAIEMLLTFDDDGQEREIAWGEDNRGKLRLMGDGGSYLNSEQREAFCPLHIPPNREVTELPGSSKWTPIGRIIGRLSERLEGDKKLRGAFDAKVKELHGVLETSKDYTEFKAGMKKHAGEQLGTRGTSIEVELGLLDPRRILKTLQIFEQNHAGQFNVADGGQGVQSSVTMAALRAFSEVAGGSLFILADEPEAYLHPLAQRAMYEVFNEIAATGTQIILTTHSPHFIPRDNPAGLHKVWMHEGRTKVVPFDIEALKLLKAARGIKGATPEGVSARLSRMLTVDVREGLFARTVVLCEGESEALSLGIWAQKEGIDLAGDGVAIVASQGKFSMIDLAEFYKVLNIPVFVLFDSDSNKKGTDATKHAEHNRHLLGFAGAKVEDFPGTGVGKRHAVLAPDLESVLRDADKGYSTAEAEVNAELGLVSGEQKGIRARFVALWYAESKTSTPPPMLDVLKAIREFHAESHPAPKKVELVGTQTPEPAPRQG